MIFLFGLKRVPVFLYRLFSIMYLLLLIINEVCVFSINLKKKKKRDNEELMIGSSFVLGGILDILLQESK